MPSKEIPPNGGVAASRPGKGNQAGTGLTSNSTRKATSVVAAIRLQDQLHKLRQRLHRRTKTNADLKEKNARLVKINTYLLESNVAIAKANIATAEATKSLMKATKDLVKQVLTAPRNEQWAKVVMDKVEFFGLALENLETTYCAFPIPTEAVRIEDALEE